LFHIFDLPVTGLVGLAKARRADCAEILGTASLLLTDRS
jgi:hypothetical protein